MNNDKVKVDSETLKSLKRLKKSLPKGTIMQMAKELGYSQAMVSYVLLGYTKNDEIINRAIEIASKEQAHKKEFINRINAACI